MTRGADLLLAIAIVLVPLPVWADAHPPRPFVPDHGGPSVVVTGEIEIVFDWTTDRCSDTQIPDLPVRAFRGEDGQTNLILSHYEAYAMRGPDLDSVSLDCTPLMSSRRNGDPSMFDAYEWIAAVYALDGALVHALVHNEFQGNRYPTGCDSADYFRCWYNTITAAVSTDGGRSFDHPVAPPGHFVAGLPVRYAPDEGIFGAFSPSNIIAHDGHYYAFFKAQLYPFGNQHTCLMRTTELSDPDAWRYWDGASFERVFADPYRDDLRAMRASACAPLALPDIAQLHESVTWNTELERFVLFGTSSDPTRANDPYGFYYAMSEDLITWSRRQPLLEVRLPWRAQGNDTTYLYPSLIDPDSDGRNFETSDGRAYLYFTRLNFGSGHLDRDLLRVEVEFRP